MVKITSGAQRKKLDYELFRYACYLIVQNSEPSKVHNQIGKKARKARINI